MNNPILRFLDPQERKTKLQEFGLYGGVPKTYEGAVKSPGQGSATTKPNPLRDFATSRGADALSLGRQGGFEIAEPAAPAPEQAFLPETAKTSTNPAETFKSTLLAGGLPAHVVDGIMLNGRDESNFNPAAVGDNGNAFGILQWNGPRKRALEQFAASQGADPADPAVQAKFTLYELNGPEKEAYNYLMRTTTAGEAGAAFLNKFERPAEEHRARREAQYLGVTGDFTVPNTLSYGQDISSQDAMAPEHVGREAGNYSMGMDAEDFTTLAAKYGETEAMRILNSTTNEQPNSAYYPDAIMRFLDDNSEEDLTPAEKQAEAIATMLLPNGGLTTGAGGLSMGVDVPGGGDAPDSSPGGSASAGSPPSTAEAPPVADEKKPRLTAVDRLFNKIYGTDVDSMTDDERADRRRAVGMALSQGFQMLSTGAPMDIQPIVAQRMELQQARRASADLKKNAQGVSDMLVAAGMPELAQLPFAGESGMTAAMNALVKNSGPQQSGAAPFDLPPAVRATVAQTMADMGHGGLAEQIMQMPPGKALEDLYNATLGATPAKGEGASYSPEQREMLANQFAAAGNTFAADAIRNGLDDKTIGDLVKDQGGVAPAVQQAAGVAGAQAGVAESVDARSAEELAAAYDQAGMTEEAAVARAAGSGPEAKQAISDMRADRAAQREEMSIKERGEAVAALVPEDLENSEELKAAAKAAKTSQDLDQVYAKIAADPKTTEEKLYEMAGKDPKFMPFLVELSRAKAGADGVVPIATQMNLNEIKAVAENHTTTIAARKTATTNAAMLRQVASNPDFSSGKIQGNLIIPMQQWANSVLGEAAPDIASDASLTAARLVEVVRAQTFVAMSAGLKGAISDKETAQFLAASSQITDTRTQLLSVAQYHMRIAEIQEAEYAAMREWVSEAEKKGTLDDRADMIRYVESKVGDMKVFEQVNEETMDAWLESPDRKIGEVVQVFRKDGSSFYETYTLTGD
jgi:hypothetical protein